MDNQIFQLVNGFAGRWGIFDAAAIFFAKYSEYLLLGFLVFLAIRNRRLVKIIGLALGVALFSRLIITEIIRFLYDRPRPFEALDVIQLVPHSAGASFPSGHAAFYFALSWFLFFWNKKIGAIFLVVTALMTFARVLAGIHYPLDILVGLLIGFFSAVAVHATERRFGNRRKS